MTYKPLLSAFAIAITLFAFIPYIRTIIYGNTRPHVFSWVVWASTTFIVFLAQLDDGGGVGAWPIGVSGLITGFVALLAWLKRADVSVTRIDTVFLIAALSSISLWYATSDPVWAVIVLTAIDLLGFGPTFRKAWAFPRSESQLFFSLFALRNLVVVLALEHYSITTVLFPAVMGAACIAFVVMVAGRRQKLPG